MIDPLTRGALLHEVQFELLTRLRSSGRLPVVRAALDEALRVMDQTLEGVAENWHDRLAPAIERVWKAAIDAIRADLREWLRRTADDRGPLDARTLRTRLRARGPRSGRPCESRRAGAA